MPYDRDFEPGIRGRRFRGQGAGQGRGERPDLRRRPEFRPLPDYDREFGAPDRPPFRAYGMGYGRGDRSRGSYGAGQARSGMNRRDAFEFGGGYVGGRGYGGTNYDYQQGYRVAARDRTTDVARAREGDLGGPQGAQRYEEQDENFAYGPSRYGYGPYYERILRRRRSDEEIRDEVEEALFFDTWVDADRIGVRVEEGVVTLTGTLTSYEELRYATDDAWDVDGVRGVRTQELLVDEPDPRRSDRGEGARPDAQDDSASGDKQGGGRSGTRGRSQA